MKALTGVVCFLIFVFAAVAVERRPIMAIADYMETNGVVSAKRGMTEALREAGFAPVILPETDRESARKPGESVVVALVENGDKELFPVRVEMVG